MTTIPFWNVKINSGLVDNVGIPIAGLWFSCRQVRILEARGRMLWTGWILVVILPFRVITRMRSSSRLIQDNFAVEILCFGSNSRVNSSCISWYSEYISTWSEIVDICIRARWTEPSIVEAARMEALSNCITELGDGTISTHGDHAR